MWPRCGEGHQREGQGVVGRSVVGRSVELVRREPETRRIGAGGWVQSGAGVKDIWVWVPRGEPGRGDGGGIAGGKARHKGMCRV